jgi:hypothetical protein
MPKGTKALHFMTLCLLTVILTACGTSTMSAPTAASALPIAPNPSPSPSPTVPPTPTALIQRTPPPLPAIYISEQLNLLDHPHTYIADTCEYLKNRWDPDNAAPGTVVMLIKLNDINRGSKPNNTDGITVNQFARLMGNLQEQGFEAINSEQLADFLERNQYIPPRSVMFIQDGRRYAGNFNAHFREFWEEKGWPVVNGWSVQSNTAESLWQENQALEREGFVDHQLYSPLQGYNESASEDYLTSELKKYTNVFEEYFDKTPLAIVWPQEPGANFTKAARRVGLRLGFTANTRGPVMYNWIPLADHEDLARPAYYPEGSFEDPLMTLPRYWAGQAVESLDQVRLTGKYAADYAEHNKEIEWEYYDIVCAPTYGPIN